MSYVSCDDNWWFNLINIYYFCKTASKWKFLVFNYLIFNETELVFAIQRSGVQRF